MPDVIWASVDPAGKTGHIGFAVWKNASLLMSGVVSAIGKKESKELGKKNKLTYTHAVGGLSYDKGDVVAWRIPARNLREAFKLAFINQIAGEQEPQLFMEHPFGMAVKSVSMMSWVRGFITAMVNEVDGVVTDVNTSEWRRVASERWEVSWPKDSVLCKALSMKLVAENFGVVCSNDESDAILVGHWAMRTRTIEV